MGRGMQLILHFPFCINWLRLGRVRRLAVMSRFNSVCLALVLAGTVPLKGARAQAPELPGPAETTETLAAWEWFLELRPPDSKGNQLVDFVLPSGVFDKARADL